ncbi:MAG: hypothetical protein AAF548_10025 [Actinomycetota bacterium]
MTAVDNTVTVVAAYPGSLTITSDPAPYAGPTLRCGYFDVVTGGQAVIDIVAAIPVAGDTYLFYCWEPGDHPFLDPYPSYPIVVIYDPQTDPGPAVTTPIAAQHALDNIVFETPATATAPAVDHIVGVPSWLAVTSELEYAPVTAQAGPVWATVRPEFARATWTFGNGDDPLTCVVDATTRWDPDLVDQSSDCTHTFETSSDEPFTGEVVITWTIWQQTDRDPTGWSVWREFSLPSPVAFDVVELEAAIN